MLFRSFVVLFLLFVCSIAHGQNSLEITNAKRVLLGDVLNNDPDMEPEHIQRVLVTAKLKLGNHPGNNDFGGLAVVWWMIDEDGDGMADTAEEIYSENHYPGVGPAVEYTFICDSEHLYDMEYNIDPIAYQPWAIAVEWIPYDGPQSAQQTLVLYDPRNTP